MSSQDCTDLRYWFQIDQTTSLTLVRRHIINPPFGCWEVPRIKQQHLYVLTSKVMNLQPGAPRGRVHDMGKLLPSQQSLHVSVEPAKCWWSLIIGTNAWAGGKGSCIDLQAVRSLASYLA